MNCARINRFSGCAVRRSSRGFTLVETLAALVFMAIVIPVSVEAVRLAGRAGLVAERKAVATRVAERMLNELVVTGQWQGARPTGEVRDNLLTYRWYAEQEAWQLAELQQLTVRVTFQAQGQEYDVRLSTLVDSATATSTTSNTTSTSTSSSSGTR